MCKTTKPPKKKKVKGEKVQPDPKEEGRVLRGIDIAKAAAEGRVLRWF